MSLFNRILGLFTQDEKNKGVKVVLSIFGTSLLDFVSLASLLPVLYLFLEDTGNTRAALSFSFVALSVILVKSLVSTCLGRYQSKCLLALYKRLSTSLYGTYYSNGLLFIREKGYSSLGHAVNYMCFAFSQGILMPLMRIAGDTLLILLVTIALLVYDWFTVLLLYVSFIPLISLYLIIFRKKVRRWGEMEYEAKTAQSRIVADTFRGYPELEINNAFPVLQESFADGVDKVIESRIKLETVNRFPIFISEFSVVIGLAIIVLAGGADAKLFAGIFAVAAFRILPALRGIISGYTQIQNTLPCLKIIEEGLRGKQTSSAAAASGKEITFNRTIEISDVSFDYGAGPVKLGSHFINKGEYVGFCGYSGIGKTTLFNIILGFIEPAEGKVLVDGVELCAGNRKSWLGQIGYVPQDVFIFKGTLAENLALGYKEIDRVKIAEIINMVSLGDWAGTLPEGIDSVLGEGGSKLSGGQKQRIGIARALYKGASVLLFDEATSALDNSTEKEINAMLDGLRSTYPNLTILSIAHREGTLAYCSRIIDLENNGKEDI